ncbi:MAG: type II toxin-antitoxin system prevent-host-death family antitoxin [Actinomycetota bacterium]
MTEHQQIVGVRELRNQVAAVVRRAAAGERLIVTVDGQPTAQVGPIEPDRSGITLWDLAAAGLVHPPRRLDATAPGTDRPTPTPIPLPADLSADRLLDASRGR